MNDSSVKLELRIDWSEIDLFGHVNNLAIMKYIQAARVNYLELVDLMQLQTEQKIGPILASINCQFRKPLFYPGQVTIYSKVDSIKNTSFRIQHTVYNDKHEISAEAHDIIVFYDFDKNSKLAISEGIRKNIEALENQDFGNATNAI
jgi:acyl-CoA thioester hydrolase